MKKSSFAILFLLLLIIISVDLFNHSNYQAVIITDDCRIGIDYNQNGKIQENEYEELSNIRNFCSDKDIIENEKLIGNLSEIEKIYLKIISKKQYEKLFLNALIRNDKNTLTVNFQNAEKLLLDEGLALPKDTNKIDVYKSAIFKHKNDAKNKEIVLFNEKSLKYHKLDCKNALNSKNKHYIFKEDLPPRALPCNFCYNIKSQPKNIQNTNDNIKLPERKYTYGNIQLFIEPGVGTTKPSPKCTTKLCKALKQEIVSAEKSIDIAVYDINMPEIIEELEKAYKKGIKINFVTDDSKRNNYDFANVIIYDDKLQKDAKYLMHNKFFIFDEKKVWTGSANITTTDLSGFNANNAVLIKSEEIAKIYKDEFENFNNKRFHSAKSSKFPKTTKSNQQEINIYFSPQDKTITNQIIPEIKKAEKYIYIPIFIITHQKLAEELILAKKRGVDVKLIIDATSARNKYSQHTLLRKNDIPVKTENFAGKMHMKTIIIDDKITFLGSMNFTKSGNIYNDENCIRIKNEEFAKNLKSEFIAIWSKIPDKYLHYDPAAESPESIGSCFDGIDNDYDGKIDFQDTGCKMQRK